MLIHHAPAANGGRDLTIHLRPEQAAALGAEFDTLTDWFDTVLIGLAALRSGVARDPRTNELTTPTENLWYWLINDLDTRLWPRLEGIRDAAIRAHAQAGGSYGHLSLAMDCPKSTAQRRRDSVTGAAPSFWETWATHGGPNRQTVPEGAIRVQADVATEETGELNGRRGPLELPPAE